VIALLLSSCEALFEESIDIPDKNFLNALKREGLTKELNLRCGINVLTALDVSGQTDLETLWCNNNALTSLDVSNNVALKSLLCGGNQLPGLDVSNNPLLEMLRVDEMPSLYQVCTSTEQSFMFIHNGSPNAYVTNDCNN